MLGRAVDVLVEVDLATTGSKCIYTGYEQVLYSGLSHTYHVCPPAPE